MLAAEPTRIRVGQTTFEVIPDASGAGPGP
jgi:hypothetical protein